MIVCQPAVAIFRKGRARREVSEYGCQLSRRRLRRRDDSLRRKPSRDLGSEAERAFDEERSAMRLYEATGEREAEASACIFAIQRGFDLPEWCQSGRNLIIRHADTVVLDVEG